ncbi:SagB/ThcOx family dehydrogenase [Poseidonibacter lekithochrous]|uniref:SagB/ThcOx family dehydrogenase n=1 Tax=Poseidonibacter TaxID=2321187 RepID=UPI001C09469E|nr:MULTISPECIES: SagB/ThcOx family dehydrogenase [Poseidonibacter]MBU3013696.1 SagB/ThcOx family dehydrogenase [Poseidonibacter lekithochrous]MDO6826993.1 SagB/ThcOx family dehydrogenase [Poseidonibacter sp. 1_MG-2023]
MNNNLQMVYTYHNETKHSQQRYARSLGYMDWATQPDPYRTYSSTKTTLPLSFDNNTLEYSQIFTQANDEKENKLSAPLCLESISQFFQFSLGLAAIKEYGEQSWALRCNASSGNLQPSEAYILANEIQGIKDGLHHYSPKEHELELLSSSKENLNLPKNSFLVCLSSIVWREAWKYGERSWRYTQLDCGHALKALEISALILGWKIEVLNTKDSQLESLIGFNQSSRYVPEERELADMLILVSKDTNVALTSQDIDISLLRKKLQEKYEGKANQLSQNWHKWDILEKIEDATLSDELDIKKYVNDKYELNPYREPSLLAKDIVLKRRSAQVMNKEDCTISKKEFETILGSVKCDTSTINLVLFVHSVEELESGLYILIRNKEHKSKLQTLLKDEFLWEKVDTKAGELYKLQNGDFKFLAKAISCNQDIASDGAFTLGMLAEFTSQLEKYGSSKYKHLYWDCGAVGQQLYLEATSLNLSATGIGCFLDNILHETLGLISNQFQTLYHFTIGRGLVDSRLTTLKPYKRLRRV